MTYRVWSTRFMKLDHRRWSLDSLLSFPPCIPLYGVDKPRINQKFVIALQYPSMFYLPPNSLFQIEEGIVRFTLIQVAHGTAVQPRLAGGKPATLSSEFFGFLKTQLIRFLGGVLPDKISKELEAYGEIILSEAKALGLQ